MRKTLLAATILIIFTTLAWLSLGIVQKAAEKEKLEAGTPIPDFSFEDLDGQFFSSKDLRPTQAVVIKYFDPGCDHCQAEARDLRESIHLMEDTQIVLISPANKENLIQFQQNFDFNEHSQIKILQDVNLVFEKYFGAAAFPCSFVYDQQHRLLEFISGEVKMAYIHQLLSQH